MHDSFFAATSSEFLHWQRQQVPLWKRGRWEATRKVAHPIPDAPDGLPTGWRPVSGFTATSTVVWCLVRRDTGGWLLVSHTPTSHETVLVAAKTSLAHLHEAVQRGIEQARVSVEVGGWLTGVILDMYDPDDPAEAAEQVLLALCGKVRTPPRASVEAHH